MASLAVQSCHGMSCERKAVKGSIFRLAYGNGSKTHEKGRADESHNAYQTIYYMWPLKAFGAKIAFGKKETIKC